jgi:hypothetical protein
MRDERLSVRAQVPGGRRNVVVQVLRASSWHQLTHVSSASDGRVRARTRLQRTAQVRLFAPAVTKQGRRLAAYTSRSRRVRVTAQHARLVVDRTAFVGEVVHVRARFEPARPGRRVQLQGRDGFVWSTVATTREDTRGRAVFAVGGATPGSFTYRAVGVAFRGAPAFATGDRSAEILPSEITVSDRTHVLNVYEERTLTDVDPGSGSMTFANSPDAPRLGVGDLLPMMPSSMLPTGGLFRVTDVTPTSGNGSVVSTEPASLPDIVENVPPDFSEFAAVPLETTIGDLPDGVVLERGTQARLAARRTATQRSVAGLRSLDMPEIRLKYNRSVEQGDSEVGLEGYLHFTPGVDFEYHAKLFRPADWRIGVHETYDLRIEADANTKLATFEASVPLPSVRGGVLVMVGPVPVVFTYDVGPKVKFEAEGKVGVQAVAASQGSRAFGLHRSDGRVGFYNTGNDSPSVSLSPYVAGTATLFGGLEADLDAYGIAGPFIKAGYELVGEAKLDTGGFTCSLYHRPVTEFGFRTSDLLDKLFRYKEKASIAWDYQKQVLHECDLSDPVISTASLPDAMNGNPYSFRLTTKDNRDGTWAYSTSAPHPSWLALDPGTGTLSGTPRQGDVGQTTVPITFTDGRGKSVSATLPLTVSAIPPPPPPTSCHTWELSDLDISVGDYVRVWESGTFNSYSGNIDWGDGASTSISGGAGEWTHTYNRAGTFTVRVSGSGSFGSPPTPCSESVSFTVRVH